MAMLSSDDSSLEALEALLTFRQSVTLCRAPPSVHPEIPVPDPLNPSLPHLIEGDFSPMLRVKGRFSLKRAQKSIINHPPVSNDVPSVPNPLEELLTSHSTPPSYKPTFSLHHQSVDSRVLTTEADQDKKPIVGTDGVSRMELAVRTDRIQDALNSKPQRGKKRRNLNDQERLELTRTRNREHAKCTRMKKKARHLELVEMEKMYLVLKSQQELNASRRTCLIKLIEGVSSPSEEQDIKICPYIGRLRQLAMEELQHPQASVFERAPIDAVALSENSATVKVLFKGTDYSTGDPKSMAAFLSVDFGSASTEMCSIALHWVLPECRRPKMFPSVSASSFDN
ncbi:hypothetical protein HJC23_009797 [Cyclotella cryptica]|uniref:BZIP domain-containing protein n=1 Tax=Cyclotella cryptica TaxID=29204 RepID=A0ABD3PS53_9STRA|eukprot:CCRYP_012172-RA/>CCRYP_012172-RA protein AED:0.20 eAED:0.20 QI:227/1/1/1/0.5/0.33/3/229/339